MSLKLSELLEAASASLQNQRARCYQCGDNQGQKQAENDMFALRAIAPALVAAMKDAVERHIEVDDWNLCPACRFEHILEEAGVTCE